MQNQQICLLLRCVENSRFLQCGWSWPPLEKLLLASHKYNLNIVLCVQKCYQQAEIKFTNIAAATEALLKWEISCDSRKRPPKEANIKRNARQVTTALMY